MDQKHTSFPSIGIIADDLTSAADGGSPFLKRGMKVSVVRNLMKQTLSPTFDVVAIDCASRSMNKADAASIVGIATRELSDATILFKTIDSTLRGHIREELGAAFVASGRERIVVAPAYPEAGRTTVMGVQYIDGVAVDLSPYALDPAHPATISKIADLIPNSIADVTILDAESQSELNAQVAAIEHPEKVLWVGSPGLAQALAEIVYPITPNDRPTLCSKHSLIVVGSANKVSREQAKRAHDAAFATCIVAPDCRTDEPDEILDRITIKAVSALDNKDITALIATGGDTMHAMLEKLQIDIFELIGEFEPGFPMGCVEMKDGRSLVLGMKAGGFGDANTLYSAAEYLNHNSIFKMKDLV